MVVKYRRPKTFTRRTLLKRAGTAALTASAALVIPRMVHANPIPQATAQAHPTWDELLDHVGARLYPMLGEPFGPAKDGRHRLREWVHGLVLHPARPQRALLLTGPEASGKTMFHDAMGLLLPAKGVVHVPGDWSALEYDQTNVVERVKGAVREREIALDNAWLVVVNDVPAAYVRLFERPRYRDGRFLKWSLAYNRCDRPLPNTIHFDLEQPAILVPKMDLIRRLEDERDAFQRTLRNYA